MCRHGSVWWLLITIIIDYYTDWRWQWQDFHLYILTCHINYVITSSNSWSVYLDIACYVQINASACYVCPINASAIATCDHHAATGDYIIDVTSEYMLFADIQTFNHYNCNYVFNC